MLTVETIGRIRRERLLKGKTIKEIARDPAPAGTARVRLRGRLLSNNQRSPRLRNPDQLRQPERYRKDLPLKGVKIAGRYGVKFGRRLTD